jgi:hypothetical protein
VGVIFVGIVGFRNANDLVGVRSVPRAVATGLFWSADIRVRIERAARIVSATCVSGWVIEASLILGEDV